jgi:hypothetical protein
LVAKVHSDAVVAEILNLLAQGKSQYQLSREYDISENTIRRWRKNAAKHAEVNPSVEINSLSQLVEKYTKNTPEPLIPDGQTKGYQGKVVLAIPDLHCPFHHPDALAFLLAVHAKINPDEVICLGDEVDFHAFSRWPKDPDGLSPGGELRSAIEALIPFYLAFPNVKVCVSNHTIRPHKLMKLTGLPAAMLPAYSTMLNAPDGWSWHEHIIIDGVRYMHGDQGKGGKYGWTSNSEVYHQSVVVGHWHSKAGVFYDSDMFNVNAGCLIDPTAYAFDYARHSHKKANLGCAVITRGRKATFIPMLLDGAGRWVGYI